MVVLLTATAILGTLLLLWTIGNHWATATPPGGPKAAALRA